MTSIYETKPNSAPEKWICFYPAFINSRRTIAEGRRIPKEKAVENPVASEIFDVLQSTGLPIRNEQKSYPRDCNRDAHVQGRIRVQLKNDDGALLNPAFPNRTSVMLHAAELIPKLKSRQMKSAPQDSSAAQALKGGGGKKKKR